MRKYVYGLTALFLLTSVEAEAKKVTFSCPPASSIHDATHVAPLGNWWKLIEYWGTGYHGFAIKFHTEIYSNSRTFGYFMPEEETKIRFHTPLEDPSPTISLTGGKIVSYGSDAQSLKCSYSFDFGNGGTYPFAITMHVPSRMKLSGCSIENPSATATCTLKNR